MIAEHTERFSCRHFRFAVIDAVVKCRTFFSALTDSVSAAVPGPVVAGGVRPCGIGPAVRRDTAAWSAAFSKGPFTFRRRLEFWARLITEDTAASLPAKRDTSRHKCHAAISSQIGIRWGCIGDGITTAHIS